MFFKKVLDDKKLVREIYESGRFKRYTMFIIGVILLALSFNIFILPSNMVFGVSGIAVVLKSALNINPSYMILIVNLLLIFASLVYLGKDVTKYTIVGSILYPVLVELTSGMTIDLGSTEPVIIALTGAVICGFGNGLIFRAGYTTGGTDVIKQIVSKYGKTSMGQATIYVEGIIVTLGIFTFGWQSFIYSIISLAAISTLTDKVMLGTSEYKSFQVITDKDKEIKQFIFNQLHRGVAIIDNKGIEEDGNRLLFCTVPTKEYFLLKEGITRIDKNARFIITDTYEVNGLD